MSEDRVVGYLALSRMRRPTGWLCLAPLAVQPERQGQGIARALLDYVACHNDTTIVARGRPSLFMRAGFSPHRAETLSSPDPLPQILTLGPDTDAPLATLLYPAAFG